MKLLQQELTDPQTMLFRITADQYYDMIDRGIILDGEPFELLDGVIVRKIRSARGKNPTSIGDDHATAVDILATFNERFRRAGCYLRIQQPVRLPPVDVPEPDGTIVKGTWADYVGRTPRADDILCIIEVADSSLRRDRTTKLEIYARAGVRQYMIINLPDRIMETYAKPNKSQATYEEKEVLSSREKVTFPTTKGPGLTVPVKSILPPAPKSRSSNGRH